jgi:hypothetical protein
LVNNGKGGGKEYDWSIKEREKEKRFGRQRVGREGTEDTMGQ